jgi:hypothetical protein
MRVSGVLTVSNEPLSVSLGKNEILYLEIATNKQKMLGYFFEHFL